MLTVVKSSYTLSTTEIHLICKGNNNRHVVHEFNRLPTDVVDASLLETSKARLDQALGNMM